MRLKIVTECLLCSSVKVVSLPYAEKIFSEYSNYRNPLMSMTFLFQGGQFRQFETHLQISVVSILMC